VMVDESGESMELMEEVPLKELGEAELERLVWGCHRLGAASRQIILLSRSVVKRSIAELTLV